MVLGNASAYARNVASKINERAKASKSASCISRAVEKEKGPLRFAQGSPTFVNLHRCNLKKGKTLFHSLVSFSVSLFLSVRNIIAEMSRCFVQGNVATTEGYITEKMPKETKENGEVGKSNEFSGCLVPLFRLCPFSYLLAISSSRGAVKSFVWTTREGSRGTFRKKLVRGGSSTVLLITRTFASGNEEF